MFRSCADIPNLEEEEENKMEISDQTGEQERSLRRQIYLTIQSSLDFEECTHKLLKTMGEGHEVRVFSCNLSRTAIVLCSDVCRMR